MTSHSGFHRLPIVAVQRETEDAISVTFAVPDLLQDAFAHRPGQYLTVRATIDGTEQRRSYSICSAPGEPLQIAIKRLPGGLFSCWAHGALAPGHAIDAMPPAGRFVLPPAGAPRTILAIAAGSGITPILSILKTVLAREPRSRAALIYGSRSTAAILFREELEALKDRHMGRLAITQILSREQQDIPILNGRIDAAKLAALLPGHRPDLAFLCGPGAMIADATAALLETGLPAAQILSERFQPDGQPARPPPAALPGANPFATATVIADGVRTDVPLREHEPLLDAALRAGLDLPYSCRAGMCSTCRARVLEGAVRMDVNYGLEPWETAAGYVLTCQSHPTTPQVTVDYDHV